jgi:predicted N-acetyltransferase YhbS
MSTPVDEPDELSARRQRFLSLGPWHATLRDGSSLHVRVATPEDAEAVWQITTDAYQEHRGQLDPPNGSDFETPADVRLQLETGAGLIALIDGTPAGSLRVEFKPGFLYIGRVGVKTACRRLQIGHRLMQTAHVAAHVCGYREIRLGTRAQLDGNLRFYDALGYKVSGAHKHPRGTDVVIFFTLHLTDNHITLNTEE